MRASNLLVLAISFLLSCGVKSLPPLEYKSWITDEANGLHKKKEIGKYMFDLQFQPMDYSIYTDAHGNLTNSELEAKRKEDDGGLYFILKIGHKDGDIINDNLSAGNDIQKLLYYYSFNFKDDIYLEVGGREIPCSTYHFERSYTLSDARTFVIGFENVASEEDKVVVIDSRVIGLGKIKISFADKDLKNTPLIKLAI